MQHNIALYTNRANYLVFPVSLLQSMPTEWRSKFTALLEEYNERFQVGCSATYEVTRTDCDGDDPYGYRHDRFEPENAWDELQSELKKQSAKQ